MAALHRLWLFCILALSLLNLSTAQSHGLQACQGQCVTDLVQQANELGCSSGDILCLCNSKGFLPGVYDCANKACPAGTDNSSLVSYESTVCAAATSASLASASSLSSSSAFSVTLIPSLTTSGTPASSTPLTTASLSGGATVTIYTAAPPAQASSSLATSPSNDNNGGLSTGAKAGIGIGVSLGALVIVGLFAFFCFRQRRRKPMRVDSFHARSRPEYSRDEIHGNGIASFGHNSSAYADGTTSMFPDMAQPEHAYVVPPLPEKSRARAFSSESGSRTGFGAGGALEGGRPPSLRQGEMEKYAAERYSWSTDPRSEGIGFGKDAGSWSGMSPVSTGGNGNGGGGGAMSEVSRSPTIGGPEYRNLREGRRPSFTAD